MRDGVQVGGTVSIPNPKALLSGGLKTCVIPLALGAQGVDRFEVYAVPVDGKSVIVGNGDILGATAVLLAIVPVFVFTGAGAGFGTLEGTTKLLPGAVVVGEPAITVHGKPGITEGRAGGQLLNVLGVSGIDRNEAFPGKLIVDHVVDSLDIIPGIADEVAFLNGKEIICLPQHLHSNLVVKDIGGGGHLEQREAGHDITEHMVLVAPIELVVSV